MMEFISELAAAAASELTAAARSLRRVRPPAAARCRPRFYADRARGTCRIVLMAPAEDVEQPDAREGDLCPQKQN